MRFRFPIALLSLAIVAGPLAATEPARFTITPGFTVVAHVETPAPFLTYAVQYAAARESGRPLIVGVRCDPPAGDWLGCRVDDATFGEGEEMYVAVCKPKAKVPYWVGKLPATTTTSNVQRHLTRLPGCACGADCLCFPCGGNCSWQEQPAQPNAIQQVNASVIRNFRITPVQQSAGKSC